MPLTKLTTNKEKARLEKLHQLMVLDTPPEALFDEIVNLVSQVCGTPIALIGFIDENRQWFKANIGLETIKETHRDLAFSTIAGLENQLIEVSDTTLDARFSASPFVTGYPHIRFYAGVPLVMPTGENVGNICIIGHEPKTLTLYQKGILLGLANIVIQALIHRLALIEINHQVKKTRNKIT